MAPFSITEISQPKTFFYVFSLRSGAELVTMTILINKISGFFGMLAILTGVHLSTLQLTMYLYSMTALVLTLYLFPHIRRQSPLQCLTLAYFYAIDSIVNAAYTAAFALSWFWVLANHSEQGAAIPNASSTTNPASGFPLSEHNGSNAELPAAAANGLKAEQSTVTFGQGVSDGSPVGLGGALFQTGSVASITIICTLWIIRIYFVFVMFAYARSVLRQHIATTSSPSAAWQSSLPAPPDHDNTNLAENPFAENREEGLGWQGQLGRAMLKVAPHYWLGPDEDREWMRGLGGKFNRKNIVEPVGVSERERRRRSGTGPPAPAIELPRFQGQRNPSETEGR